MYLPDLQPEKSSASFPKLKALKEKVGDMLRPSSKDKLSDKSTSPRAATAPSSSQGMFASLTGRSSSSRQRNKPSTLPRALSDKAISLGASNSLLPGSGPGSASSHQIQASSKSQGDAHTGDASRGQHSPSGSPSKSPRRAGGSAAGQLQASVGQAEAQRQSYSKGLAAYGFKVGHKSQKGGHRRRPSGCKSLSDLTASAALGATQSQVTSSTAEQASTAGRPAVQQATIKKAASSSLLITGSSIPDVRVVAQGYVSASSLSSDYDDNDSDEDDGLVYAAHSAGMPSASCHERQGGQASSTGRQASSLSPERSRSPQQQRQQHKQQRSDSRSRVQSLASWAELTTHNQPTSAGAAATAATQPTSQASFHVQPITPPQAGIDLAVLAAGQPSLCSWQEHTAKGATATATAARSQGMAVAPWQVSGSSSSRTTGDDQDVRRVSSSSRGSLVMDRMWRAANIRLLADNHGGDSNSPGGSSNSGQTALFGGSGSGREQPEAPHRQVSDSNVDIADSSVGSKLMNSVQSAVQSAKDVNAKATSMWQNAIAEVQATTALVAAKVSGNTAALAHKNGHQD